LTRAGKHILQVTGGAIGVFVTGRLAQAARKFGVQFQAGHLLRIVHGPQGILQNLVGFDPGYFIKKPAATRVHQHRVPLHFEQAQYFHLFQFAEGAAGMFLQKVAYRIVVERSEHDLDIVVAGFPGVF
jgi:hypothetical protein